MPQQIHDQHRAATAVWSGMPAHLPAWKNAEVLPFRDVFMDGLVERDAAFPSSIMKATLVIGLVIE